MSGTAEAVRRALGRVIDPEIRKPITELDMVGDVRADAGSVTVDLRLTIVGCPAATSIERDVREAALSVDGVEDVHVDVSVMTRSSARRSPSACAADAPARSSSARSR